MPFAHVRQNPGFEPGLVYQISADVDRFPSLVWSETFIAFFEHALMRANPQFDPYGVHKIASKGWMEIARVAEEVEDRLRSKGPLPSDMLLQDKLRRLLNSTGVRLRVVQALQLTAQWLRDAAAHHPTLTFYGT